MGGKKECERPGQLEVAGDEDSRPAQRQIARQTLQIVGERASEALEKAKSYRVVNNPVTRLYFRTMATMPSPATSMAKNKWDAYGDHLLDNLDSRLDRAFGAGSDDSAAHYSDEDQVAGMMDENMDNEEGEQKEEDGRGGAGSSAVTEARETAYTIYWNRLKQMFMASQWYRKVDDILIQNDFVNMVGDKAAPASEFYNTVTEEFL